MYPPAVFTPRQCLHYSKMRPKNQAKPPPPPPQITLDISHKTTIMNLRSAYNAAACKMSNMQTNDQPVDRRRRQTQTLHPLLHPLQGPKARTTQHRSKDRRILQRSGICRRERKHLRLKHLRPITNSQTKKNSPPNSGLHI